MIKALQTVGVIGRLDKRRGIEIVDACVRTFFDMYLKDAPASDITSLQSRYPELHSDFTRAFPRTALLQQER